MNTLAFIFNLGGTELFILAFVVLLLFGGKKLPELMRGIGKGIREFNTAKNSIQNELEDTLKEEEPATKNQ